MRNAQLVRQQSLHCCRRRLLRKILSKRYSIESFFVVSFSSIYTSQIGAENPETGQPKRRGRGLSSAVAVSTPKSHRVSRHRFGLGGECDRISVVSEGLIRLTLVLAIQSFLRPPFESCHQWSRLSAICARGDNDPQCAFHAGPVPVSSRRFQDINPPRPRGVELLARTDGGHSLDYCQHNFAKYATRELWQGRSERHQAPPRATSACLEPFGSPSKPSHQPCR